MAKTTVQVTNISADKNEEEIKSFFSFCGKISDIEVQATTEGATKNATVTFEKATAAKTALLLSHTKFGDTEISVTGEDGEDDEGTEHRETDEITQEEKPRARILAEYLAHGYLVADTGLNRALALDARHGVTERFFATLQKLENKTHAIDRVRDADQNYGLTQRANSLLTGLGSYFEKASNTPTGQRIVKFYTEGQRQVSDIHNEAKRLADIKKQEAGGSSYKAAGLHKVFGEEKKEAPGKAPANAAATESVQEPTAPSTVAGNEETHTQVPKA